MNALPETSILTKTRFAPTPSGYLHLGNILSFGITAALAKKHGAKILLRIDDLDQARANSLYVQDIFDTLDFLGIEWDEGPEDAQDFEKNWSQVSRIDLYTKAIAHLKDNNRLFACVCSRANYTPETCSCPDKKFSFDTLSANWRIKTDKCPVKVKQINGELIESSLPDEMQNFIIRKKDGYPSYQLASVVDDLHYGINLVVRGQDLWDSTLAQHFLADQLGYPAFGEMSFYHHPLIKGQLGEKLSKSAGATSVKYLRENGKDPAEIFSAVLQHTGLEEKAETWEGFLDMLSDNDSSIFY